MRFQWIVLAALIIGIAAGAEHADLPRSGPRSASPQPAKTYTLPKGKKDFPKGTLELLADPGKEYCQAVAKLAKQIADASAPVKPEVAARVKQESRLAARLCEGETWLGLGVGDGVNDRFLVDFQALQDGLANVFRLAQSAGQRPVVNQMQLAMQRLRQDQAIFINPQIRAIWADIPSHQWEKAWADLIVWVSELSQYLRTRM